MSKFQVGDVLRIKQWQDMADEFGTIGGDICCHAEFVQDMRYLCGETFTVKDIINDAVFGYQYRSVENIEGTRSGGAGIWFISEDMLEPYVEDMEIDVDATDRKNLDEFLYAFQVNI